VKKNSLKIDFYYKYILKKEMPKITTVQSKEEDLEEIITEVKSMKVSKKKSVESIEFPKDVEEISDCGDTDDTDDIVSKFDHDKYREWEHVTKYRDISIKCSNYLKNITVLKLSDNQKKGFNRLINKIYVKLILYRYNIQLNHLNPIYSNFDEKSKDLLFKIKRLVNKLIDNSALLKKKISFKKTELLPFFNNTAQLYNLIIEIMEYLIANKNSEEEIVDK